MGDTPDEGVSTPAHRDTQFSVLMFIFGAGASFDSDPDRPAPGAPLEGYDYRPPLAAGLFSPDNQEGRAAIARFPRAAPLLMRLRNATRQGLDVEEVLEEIATGEATYPDTAAQLLAFRAYLADLLDSVPREWDRECQGLTNYVLALDQADRWNKVLHGDAAGAIAVVTFNYDALLEGAVHRVTGQQIRSIEDYVSIPGIRTYKPHGSVTWRQAAGWDQPPNHWLGGRGALDKAIAQAATLDWSADIRVQATDDDYQDRDDATRVWLPALSIPVRRKSTFTMPEQHRDALIGDLTEATTVIAVGWRARERHFLHLLEEHMRPSANLVVVAEDQAPADEAVDRLWETGRFDRYAISTLGFSGFVDPSPGPTSWSARGFPEVRLQDVLTGLHGIWVTRAAGKGLPDEPDDGIGPDAQYAEL